MHVVDLSPEATALRSNAVATSNRLSDLSLKAGGLAGLLKLISGSEDLEGPQQLALHHLAGLAQELENVLEAEAVQLGEIVRGQ